MHPKPHDGDRLAQDDIRADDRQTSSPPRTLPLEARRAIWDRVWARLLASPAIGTDGVPTADVGEDAA